MERLNAYSKPTPDGGVSVDAEGMMVDLVTVAKAAGCPSKAEFLEFAGEIWDKVKVQIKIPNDQKN